MNSFKHSSQPVSLVSTVFNDREGLESFFLQMSAQTRHPSEIVIVDAGSKDGTWELLQAEMASERPWKLMVWQDMRCNVARGRNLAIERATHDLIASTDIGCDWDAPWLEELVSPLINNPKIEIVVGSWGVREKDLVGDWARVEFGLRWQWLQTSSLPQTQSTSRSIAYRKSLWKRLGGYPEDLSFSSDDTTFDMLIKADGACASSAPIIRCYWRRHDTLRGFLKEQYRYFLGNGEARITGRHFVLVGTRLTGEAVGFLAGVILMLTSNFRLAGAICAMLAFISVAFRFRRWIPASRRIGTMGVNYPLWRVALFETLCRVYGLRGYLRGWLRGSKSCRDCRRRLQTAGII
jgi:glycosyltransferase involved in cell wall biosynthesis